MLDPVSLVPPQVNRGGLDAEQMTAAGHRGGPLLIVAGAGTGKTRTLVGRLANLIENGTPPERVLLVTFSRRAAEEMIRRLAPLVGAETARRVPAGTFHAVAYRLLCRHGEALGLGEGFSVMDQSDAADLMNLARQDAAATGQAVEGRRRPARKETLVSLYSRVVNARQPLAQVLREHYPWIREHGQDVAEIFDRYVQAKRQQMLLDFDDLLLFWRAACLDPVTGPALASGFDHVLVDEYQDSNLLQADVVRALAASGCLITAVGDDAQAIYGFRAASVRNMLDFGSDFPGAVVVKLERNYRSTQPILDLANAVMSVSGEGYGKRLWSDQTAGPKPVLALCPDEGAQAEAVCERVLELLDGGIELREQAVLFRSAHHSDVLELELRRRGVPFIKYGGLRFLEAAHIRDLVAALRLVQNRRDELAWFRLLQLLEGVGPAKARRITAVMASGGDASALDDRGSLIPAAVAVEVRSLDAALAHCRSGQMSPTAQLDCVVSALQPLISRHYDDAEVRLRDLEALSVVANGFESISQLAAELALDPPSSTSDLAGAPWLDEDYLTLSTVHSAKGGEWAAVHLIHATDGMFPSDMATGTSAEIEEERRLFYVALTRAKSRLQIYTPLRYHYGGHPGRGDRHGYAQRSRFLPPEVDSLLDQRPVRSRHLDLDVPLPATPLGTAVDLELRSLW